MHLAPRAWLPDRVNETVERHAALAARPSAEVAARLSGLVAEHAGIHDRDCVNLNPAANVMNPAAEALLAAGLGSRPSLGHPGDKYETGLEAAEAIEVVAAELAAEVFRASQVELRVLSGAMANLTAFMALARPGDSLIAPPPAIGGHVTHHAAGCAGLFGLVTHPAPVDAAGYSVDPAALEELALRVRPRIITIGGSLNLFAHPVRALRAIADRVGAVLLFDAAHLSGLVAGGAWPNPLDEGAHLVTMSTYKSLGGPPGGLIVTRDAEIARKLDAVAFPGLTANADMGRVAALARGLLDWRDHGPAYAARMIAVAQALAAALADEGIEVFAAGAGATASHQFALPAAPWGGGQAAARRLRSAGLLVSGIGLPLDPVAGDANGIRLGTPEIVRRGMTEADMPELARLIARGLRANDPAVVAGDTAAFRARFAGVRYVTA